MKKKARKRAQAAEARPAFVLSCVDVPRAGTTPQAGSTLAGKGWAIGEADIASIGVYLGETFLCHASYGQPRPEIGRDYGHYKQAHHSGFVFSARLPAQLEPHRGADLLFRFVTVTGSETRRVVRLAWPKDEAETGGAARPWPIRLAVEECRVDGAGRLRLRGWAAARTGLSSLELYLGENRLHTPERHLPRPDIAARHPGYPDAAQSGFSLTQHLDAPPHEHDAIRVVGRAGDVQRQVIVPLAGPDAGRRLLHEGEVTLCCDTLRLNAAGMLAIAGWATGTAETREIEVLANGASLGLAEIGLPRPDIGNRFPRLPAARHAGFRFHQPTTLAGGDRIALAVRDTAGAERLLELRLPGGAALEISAANDLIHAAIDTPALNGDRAAAPIRGGVTIAGWAVSSSGIAAIRVWSDDIDLGEAHIGARREDIGAAYPDLPEALTAGFALNVPHRRIGDGEHAMRVVITSRSGASSELGFRVVLHTEDDALLYAPRRSVPYRETALMLAGLGRMGALPHFTVVIRPGNDGAMHGLSATLDSLRLQNLTRWRVVLPLPEAAEPAVQALLVGDSELAARVHKRLFDGNAALWGRPGRDRFELLCLLRAGDVLGADALMALAVEARLSDADFVYADERCQDLSRDGVHPFAKPGWSPDLLTSTNYLGRAWCAARPLVRRAGLDLRAIAQHGHYHAALLLTEHARRIAHTPACVLERAGRRMESAKREQAALTVAMDRRGIAAEILPGRAPGAWRLQRATTPSTVSVVIATCGARGLIRGAIETLRAHTAWPAIEIICLDDIPAEDAELKAWLQGAADRVIPIDFAFNWSRANNMGAAAATGAYLLFLNDDTEARDPHWLHALMEQAQRPEVGVVGPQLLYGDGKVQHAGMFLRGADGLHAFRFAEGDEPGPFGLALVQRDVAAVTGACMLMRRSVFSDLGGFDESHGVIKNDLDFCLRAHAAGLRVIYTPHASLIHHEMASRAHLPDSHDAAGFQGAWALRQLRGDPWWNPNLSDGSEDYAVEAEPVELLQPGYPLIDRDRVRRILVAKLDHIGDFITALPALQRLRHGFPQARITLLAGAAGVALADLSPAIDDVEAFEFFDTKSATGRRPLGPGAYDALAARLTPRQFDLAIDLRVHSDTRHVLRHTGAALCAGFDHGARFPWLDIAVTWDGDPKLADKRTQIADTLLRLADAVVNAAADTAPALNRADPAGAVATLRRRLHAAGAPAGFAARPIVCLHPGAGTALKQWPAADFAGLIALLLADHDVSIVLIGAADETAIAAEVAALAGRPEAVLSLAGTVSLAELPTLLAGCVLFVGNDSGPKHLAAALGVATVGVHAGQVDAAEWGPSGPRAIAVRRRMTCGPCYIADEADCPRALACIRGIRPREVYRACRLLLGFAAAEGAFALAAVGSKAAPGRRSRGKASARAGLSAAAE